MKIVFIRHGATAGNLEGRYVGRTDEGLSGGGRAEISRLVAPVVERVSVSPMRRCLETAVCLYPGANPIIVPDFRECDFGDFEYKSYAELNGNAEYQAWIDSGGALPFPGGESREAFSARCVRAFGALVRGASFESLAIIAHGGTIMAIFESYVDAKRDYFDWRIKNGEMIFAEWTGRVLTDIHREAL